VAHYADVQWRLDVRTSSRAVAAEAEPVFLVELTTEGGNHSGGSSGFGGGGGGGGRVDGGSGGGGGGGGGGGHSSETRRVVEAGLSKSESSLTTAFESTRFQPLNL
jgi:hypothetical protein